MFIISVLSVGAPGVEIATGALDVWEVVVEEIGGKEDAAAEGELKWTVRSAGPDWFFDRETVMGTPGLWYLRRRREVRQKFLKEVSWCCKEEVGRRLPSACVSIFLLESKVHM
jgi:hypothetical protein